jgi:hypothetical protein
MTRFGESNRSRRFGLVAAAAVATGLVEVAVAVPGTAGAQVACTIAVADDSYSTMQDTPLVVDPIGVVTNDTICGTDGLVISDTQPTHGSLGGTFDDSEGGFTYTPDPGFTGTDSFTYHLEDVTDSPVATVTITVGAVAPTTVAPTTTAPATTSTPITSAGNGNVAAVQAVQATPAFTG